MPPRFFAPAPSPIFIGPFLPPPSTFPLPPECLSEHPCDCEDLPFHQCYCDDDGDGVPNFWEDDDCDGVPNLVDPTTAANGCFILDIWCLGPNEDSDDDGDGIRNQDEMLHPCNTRVFTPDPETHLELDALLILPGDSEWIGVRPDCGCEHEQLWLAISNPEVAMFVDGNSLVSFVPVTCPL